MKSEEDLDESKKDKSGNEFNFEDLNIDKVLKIISLRSLIFIGILVFAIIIIAIIKFNF